MTRIIKLSRTDLDKVRGGEDAPKKEGGEGKKKKGKKKDGEPKKEG